MKNVLKEMFALREAPQDGEAALPMTDEQIEALVEILEGAVQANHPKANVAKEILHQIEVLTQTMWPSAKF